MWARVFGLLGAAAAVSLLLVNGVLANGLPPGGTFTDDDRNIHEPNIEAIAAAGITRGCNPPANTFYCPSSTVTRGEMAAFLVRALNLSERLDNAFVDDDESIFEADIERLAAAEITKGCNPPVNDRYCPDGVVTRGQMAAFLVRAFGYADNGGNDLFIDDDGSIFEQDINRLGAAGVTQGCNPPTNDRYCPSSPVLRDQMASFLSRALDLAPIVPLQRVVGSWEGQATVPFGWAEIGDVYFEFRADGTYSDSSTGEAPALYWGGTEPDSSLNTYEFWGPVPGSGQIAVVFSTGVQYGRIENVLTEGDQLSFELWNDWGRRPPYGPVRYTLTRIEP